MKAHNPCLVFDIDHWWVNPLTFFTIFMCTSYARETLWR